jgi:hypothetical protein
MCVCSDSFKPIENQWLCHVEIFVLLVVVISFVTFYESYSKKSNNQYYMLIDTSEICE